MFKSKSCLNSVSTQQNIDLYCLITDSESVQDQSQIQFNDLSILQSDLACKIKKKYQGDKLRWSLKPVYINHLLSQGYDRVIYVDNDIYFFGSIDFLIEKLEKSRLLLTPHFYFSNPTRKQNWLEANYRVGLYNAGFIAANKSASEILDWWTQCCLYSMKKSYWRGLYDDQKYLDLVPVIFNDIEVIKHRGCNFAGWNCDEVDLNYEDGKLKIEKDELIFIHFAPLSIERFSVKSSVVHPLYLDYLNDLKTNNPTFEFKAKKNSILSISNYFYYIRWKLVRRIES